MQIVLLRGQHCREGLPGTTNHTCSRKIVLLHDNARPHTAQLTVTTLNRYGWECLEHPPYSPDLSPCDFHIFGPLKKAMKGRKFKSDGEVQRMVTEFLKQQPVVLRTEYHVANFTLGQMSQQAWPICLDK